MEYNVQMNLNSELSDLEQLSLQIYIYIYIYKPHLCVEGGGGIKKKFVSMGGQYTFLILKNTWLAY